MLLRDGRVDPPHYDVAQSSLVQDVVSGTSTDFYGTAVFTLRAKR